MPRIYLFIPYYGKFPNYYQLYLDSLRMNQDILTVFFITDIDMKQYDVPENAVIVHMAKEMMQQRLADMLRTVFGKTVDPSLLIKTNYKLVDFKVTFPIVFKDILEQHAVTEEDFVGWGDCDLIYGNLAKFIHFSENYHIIGGWFGHFAAIKNIESFKLFFKEVPNFFDLCTDNSKTFITDEIACREPLQHFLAKNKYKMFYINLYYCDIVPPCFYHMFRKNHYQLSKNFFDTLHPKKNIHHLFFDLSKKRLSVVYDDGSTREAAYAHFQKRAMTLPFQTYANGYFVYENEFHLSV